MTNIKYVKGDATQPIGEGTKYIVHCCNDIGAWGAGFVLALNRRWEKPKQEYKHWFDKKVKYHDTNATTSGSFKLGEIQLVLVDSDSIVVNMIGQRGIKTDGGTPPIRYSAIKQGLIKLSISMFKNVQLRNEVSMHCPRFGSGLAGGRWPHIESLIIECICSKDIPVTVYDL